uniref:HTH_Tnp_Tc3_2 domain-containing protein n=1 Tax=Heterorhabditis bacteriophora TaxID=37862 RepID=A0A1I7WIE9_HETBA
MSQALRNTIMKLAFDLNISQTSMRRTVKHKLRFHPYEICRSHVLTNKVKANSFRQSKENSRQLVRSGHQRSEKASVNVRSNFPSSVMWFPGPQNIWDYGIVHSYRTANQLIEPKQLSNCADSTSRTSKKYASERML